MRAHAHTLARFIYRCKNFYALFLVTTSLAGARKKGKPRSVVPLNGKSGLRLERFSLLSTFILKKGESPYLFVPWCPSNRVTSPANAAEGAGRDTGRAQRGAAEPRGGRKGAGERSMAERRGARAAERDSIADGTALRNIVGE